MLVIRMSKGRNKEDIVDHRNIQGRSKMSFGKNPIPPEVIPVQNYPENPCFFAEIIKKYRIKLIRKQ